MEHHWEESIHYFEASKRIDCLCDFQQGLNRYNDQGIPHTVIPGEPKLALSNLIAELHI